MTSQQCGKKLEVTVYKLPDSVSIFAPHLAGVMEAGRSYQLQCDVRDVATKDDHRVRFLCQVEMKGISSLWKRSPIITSEPYNMVVHYPPSFFSPLPETLDPAVDEEPVLNCSADGNPPPTYHWWSSAGLPEAMTGNNSVLRTSSPLPPGTYNCTASNPLASVTKVFIVLPRSQKDYPPLIVDPVKKKGFHYLVIGTVIVTVAVTVMLAVFYSCSKKLQAQRAQRQRGAQQPPPPMTELS
ncbi:hypothetical protein NHX12_031554 [Muraenolepis orangiensis]|uniref:Ig-like domain-containing protein n=1 Tax=Muraenolepis orangiensis TaxID=630683 RepID=A0A9Q0E3Y3_9TELE|nr:hypothetical protein NHX12_031554 [Muraenolepis orangiensis]